MRSDSPSRQLPSKRRILIVDSHSLVRRGLGELINDEPDLRVCAEACGQRTGLEAIVSSRPDLIIADLSLAAGDGAALIEEIRSGRENLPILVLSEYEGPYWAERAFGAGANGWVGKGEPLETLLIAIRCLLDGETFGR